MRVLEMKIETAKITARIEQSLYIVYWMLDVRQQAYTMFTRTCAMHDSCTNFRLSALMRTSVLTFSH